MLVHFNRIGLYWLAVWRQRPAGGQVELVAVKRALSDAAPHDSVGQRSGPVRAPGLSRIELALPGPEYRKGEVAHLDDPPFAHRYSLAGSNIVQTRSLCRRDGHRLPLRRSDEASELF